MTRVAQGSGNKIGAAHSTRSIMVCRLIFGFSMQNTAMVGRPEFKYEISQSYTSTDDETKGQSNLLNLNKPKSGNAVALQTHILRRHIKLVSLMMDVINFRTAPKPGI